MSMLSFPLYFNFRNYNLEMYSYYDNIYKYILGVAKLKWGTDFVNYYILKDEKCNIGKKNKIVSLLK